MPVCLSVPYLVGLFALSSLNSTGEARGLRFELQLFIALNSSKTGSRWCETRAVSLHTLRSTCLHHCLLFVGMNSVSFVIHQSGHGRPA